MSCCCKVQMEFLLLIHFEQVTKGYLSVHVAYYIRIHLISKIKNIIRMTLYNTTAIMLVIVLNETQLFILDDRVHIV